MEIYNLIKRTLQSKGFLLVSSLIGFLSYNSCYSDSICCNQTNFCVAPPKITKKIAPDGKTNSVLEIMVNNTKIGKEYILLSVDRLPTLPYGEGNLEQVLRTNAKAIAYSTNLLFTVPFYQSKTQQFYRVIEN